MKEEPRFEVGSYIYIPNVKKALEQDGAEITAYVLGKNCEKIHLYLAEMTAVEKKIVKAGCLINYNRNRQR